MKGKFSRRAMALGILLGAILAAAPVFAADFNERFEKTYPVSSNPRVSLSNVNGSVEISGWDRNEVQVLATKHANTQEKLARLQIVVNASKDSVSIKTEMPSGNNNNPGSVDYEIRVPRTASLDKVDTVNGSVEVNGIKGNVRISSVNGKVMGRALTADMELSTVNGVVDCEAAELSGSNRVKLSTVNGSVELTLPRDASARLTANTVNGHISSNMGLPVKNHFPVGSSLDTTLGSGSARVELNSVNGGISIHGGAKGL